MVDFITIKNILSSWLVLIIFLHFVFSKKFEYRYNKYLSFITVTSLVTLIYYNLHFSDISAFLELYILSIAIIILYSIFFKAGIYNTSLICIVFLQFFLISRIWIYVIYNLLNILSNDLIELKSVLYFMDMYPYLSRNIIFILLSSYLYLHVRSKYIKLEYIHKNKKVLNICLAFSFINYNFLLYTFLSFSSYKFNKRFVLVIIAFSLISLVFLILIILLLKIISEKSYMKFASEIMEHQFKIQLNHYNNLEKSVQSSRMIVHDTKHHILALDILLKNNNFDEAKEYIELLEDDLFVLERNKICDNKIVDAIIQSTIVDCLHKKIEFNYNINLPENIEINHFDLAVVFGNLLNNAVEGCESISNTDIKKFINISSNVINDNLVVKIVNSKEHNLIKNPRGSFKTTKSNNKDHGIGLISVNHSLDKYNGSISFNVCDDTFEVNFIMNTKI